MTNMCRYVVAFCLSLLFILTTGCGGKKSSYELAHDKQAQIQKELAVTTTPEINLDKPDSIAKAYLDYLLNDNLKASYELINVIDDTFFSYEDYEYTMRRSSAGWLIANSTIKVQNLTTEIKQGEAIVSVQYLDGTSEYPATLQITLCMDSSNKWKISSDGLTTKDYLCAVPADTRFYLNDIEVPVQWKTDTVGSFDYYTIPEITPREYETKIYSSLFGSVSGKQDVTLSTEEDNSLTDDERRVIINRFLSDEMFNSIASFVKTYYNNIYRMMDTNADISGIDTFISKDISNKYFRSAYEEGITLRKNSQQAGEPISQEEIIEIYPIQQYPSYILSSSEVVLNMGLLINWDCNGVLKREKIYSSVKMTNESEVWVIKDFKENAWTLLSDTASDFDEHSLDW